MLSSRSKRIDLKLTKHIIDLITENKLNFNASIKDQFFNLDIPLNLDGLDNKFLVPHLSWSNHEEYISTGNMLTRLFKSNFEKYDISDSAIIGAGPKSEFSA